MQLGRLANESQRLMEARRRAARELRSRSAPGARRGSTTVHFGHVRNRHFQRTSGSSAPAGIEPAHAFRNLLRVRRDLAQRGRLRSIERGCVPVRAPSAMSATATALAVGHSAVANRSDDDAVPLDRVEHAVASDSRRPPASQPAQKWLACGLRVDADRVDRLGNTLAQRLRQRGEILARLSRHDELRQARALVSPHPNS